MSKVLIIEDSASMRTVCAMVVKVRGHESRQAKHGQMGITLFEEEEPDLIFLDIMMPVMDGKQFAEWLRNEKGANTPIIFMSAALTDDMKELLNFENTIMLRKPANKEEILEAMEKLGF